MVTIFKKVICVTAIMTVSLLAYANSAPLQNGSLSVWVSITQPGTGCLPSGTIHAIWYFVKGTDIKKVGIAGGPVAYHSVPVTFKLDPAMDYTLQGFTANTVEVTVFPSYPPEGKPGTTAKLIAPSSSVTMYPGPCTGGGGEPHTPPILDTE
jgi:hypothetical protein